MPQPAAAGAVRPPAASIPPVDPLIEAARIPEWHPLPWPSLMRDAPLPDDAADPLSTRSEPLISRRMAWAGMMSWCWGVVILILVVAPITAMPKLFGPFTEPISAAGYGPLVAIFAIVAILIAMFGGIWLWLAMGREYDAPEDVPL